MKGTNIGEFFPEFSNKAVGFHDTLMPISLLLATFAVIGYGIRGMNGDIRGMTHGIGVALVIATLIPTFPSIANEIQLGIYTLVEEAGANPSDSSQEFGNLIVSKTTDGENEVGFFDILTDSNGGVGKAILYLVLLLVSFLALVIQYLIFVGQQFLIISGVALTPAFLTMLMVNSLKDIAVKYFLSLVAVMLWPLGFAFADLLTTALLEQAVDAELYTKGGVAFLSRTAQSLLYAFTVAIWIIVSTIGTPKLVTIVVTTGANAGGALIQQISSAIGTGASYGMMTNSTAHVSGLSRSKNALATVGAGIGGFAQGAAGGSGFVLPSMIGAAAIKAGIKDKDSATPTDYNKKASKIFS